MTNDPGPRPPIVDQQTFQAELAAQWDRRLGAIKRLAEAAHSENASKNPHDQ